MFQGIFLPPYFLLYATYLVLNKYEQSKYVLSCTSACSSYITFHIALIQMHQIKIHITSDDGVLALIKVYFWTLSII